MNRYPNICLTLLLSCLLIPPFVLKTVFPTLEPYPAIILPAGSDTVNIEDSKVSFVKTSVWAKPKDKAKSWSQIDSEKFLAPIPVYYLKYIVLTSFGFESKQLKTASVWKKKYDSILNNKITSEEIAETKNWFGQKLNKSGYISDEFMVISEEITFDVNSGKIVLREKIDEKVFRLD